MAMNADLEYLLLAKKIMDFGEDRPDRTGTGTRSLFGQQLHFHLGNDFPLLTTKKVYWRGVVGELLWFLRGETNVRSLQADGVSIWDEWADENGELGPIYSAQWRSWGGRGIDQIANVLKSIKENPFSRRHIVSAWNVEDLPHMALEPCHTLFQFYVHSNFDGKPTDLSCHLYQRSADLFLGVPFNIASYALLTHMIAHVTGLVPRSLTISFGDVHIYKNHFAQMEEQIQRQSYLPPKLQLDPAVREIDGFSYDAIKLIDYKCHPAIKAPVAI